MRGAALLLALALAAGCSKSEPPAFTAALAQAQRDQKPLLVDFSTSWCEPCKRLETETWAAPRVREWFASHAHKLVIDADAEPALAQRFRVGAFPTMVFLAPDGHELGRIVGFLDAERFIVEAEAALAGDDSVARATKALEGHADELAPHLALARALSESARDAEALAEFEWCWDHGAAGRPVEGQLFVRDYARLAHRHAPARAALAAHRDALLVRVRAEEPDRADVLLVARLDIELDDTAALLALYDELGTRGASGNQARSALVPMVFDALLDARRYADLLANAEDIAGKIEHRIEKLRQLPQDSAASAALASQRRHLAEEVEEMSRAYYEALLGVGRGAEAARIAQAWLGFDGNATHLLQLAEAARRAGHADEGRALVLAWLDKLNLSASDRAIVEKDLDEHAK